MSTTEELESNDSVIPGRLLSETEHRAIISAVLGESVSKLEIFQRGQSRAEALISWAHGLSGGPSLKRRSSVSVGRKSDSEGNEQFAAERRKSVDKKTTKSSRIVPNEHVLNAVKLQKDLDTIIAVIRKAKNQFLMVNDSNETASKEGLRSEIVALCDDHDEVGQLSRQLEQNKACLASLKTQLETEQKDAEIRMTEQDERIATLRHNKRHIQRLNELEVSLVERWERNRRTQAAIVGANEERRILEQIVAFRRRIADEERIIREVTIFNAKQSADLRTRISEWQQRYTDEMALMSSQLAEKEEREIRLQKQRERHEEIYAQRCAFVEEYLAAVAEEERLLALERHRMASAIRLQAWWRGTMVRRGLGPYKKKSKKGKKGAKGGAKAAAK